MGDRKYLREVLPCICGHGTIEVEVTTFGSWRVEGLLLRCPSCTSGNFTRAREHLIASSAHAAAITSRSGERN